MCFFKQACEVDGVGSGCEINLHKMIPIALLSYNGGRVLGMSRAYAGPKCVGRDPADKVLRKQNPKKKLKNEQN